MILSIITSWLYRTSWRFVVPGEASVAVTFGSRQAPGATFTNYSLTHVKRRPGEQRSDMDPAVATSSLSWLIWQDDLDAVSAPRPKVSDKLTDSSGVSWIIDRVEHHLLGQVFHVFTTRAR